MRHPIVSDHRVGELLAVLAADSETLSSGRTS